MWVIVEIYNSAILCYSLGDIMVWRNKEAAESYCVAVSQRNPGVFSVQNLWDDKDHIGKPCTHGYRLSTNLADPLKITGAFPLPQTVYTKYEDQ